MAAILGTRYGGSPRKTAITAGLVISVAYYSRSNAVRFDGILCSPVPSVLRE